jgi:exportin-2 (importin alpha re-exporter)
MLPKTENKKNKDFVFFLARMFGRVLEKVIIPDIQKISGSVERKIAAVGIASLLCDSKEMMDGSYSHFW